MLTCGMSGTVHDIVSVDPLKCIHGLSECRKASGCVVLHPPKRTIEYWNPDTMKKEWTLTRKGNATPRRKVLIFDE